MMQKSLFVAILMIVGCGLVLNAPGVHAQQVNVAPDCAGKFNFSAAGTNSIIQNGTGCTSWLVSYKATGFTAITLEFDYAPDVSAKPGPLARWPGSIPLTNPTAGQLVVSGTYYPWAGVQLTAATGTGSVAGTFIGWRQQPSASIVPTGTSPPSIVIALSNPGLPLPTCNAVRLTACQK